MTVCVLDSSSALACVLPDEADDRADRLLSVVLREGASVTAIWPLETAHVLLRAERRRRITAGDRQRAMEILKSFPVEIDSPDAFGSWARILPLAERYGLTVYDASYLELALRLALPMATRDDLLATAARAAGVPILD